MGPRNDMQVWPLRARVAHKLIGRTAIIKRNDKYARLFEAGRVQEFRACRITEETLDAETSHRFDRLEIVVENHRSEAGEQQQPVDHLSEAANPGDDDGLPFVDFVRFRRFSAFGGPAVQEALVCDEEERCQQHRQSHDQKRPFRQCRTEDILLRREREQYETEFTGLGEAECEQPFVTTADPENQRQSKEHDALHEEQKKRHQNDLKRVAEQHAEVDACSYRDEEQAQQEPLEGRDIAFQLMPKLGVGEHDAGKKGAKCRREANEYHQRGNAQYEEQRKGCIEFSQARHMDKAEQGPCREYSHKNYESHRAQGDESNPPRREILDEGKRDAGSVAAVVVCRVHARASDRAVRPE